MALLLGLTLGLSAVSSALPASAAASPLTCPNKVIKVRTETQPPRTYATPVKAIKTEGGVTCSKAYEVIRGALGGHLPKGWSLGTGSFKAPEGLVPEQARKGSKKVDFAVAGG
jgi:hypothetical protein